MTVVPIAEGGLDAFTAACGPTPQLLVFSASWCAPCKAMAPAIDDIARLYAGEVIVGSIDIEAAPALAASFSVRGVPTLVALRDGREVARLVGGQSKTRLAMLADTAIGDAAA